MTKENFQSPPIDNATESGAARVELKTQILGVDVKLNIEDGERPMDVKIDLNRNIAEATITPQDIRMGIRKTLEVLNSPTVSEKIRGLADSLRELNDRLEKRREEKRGEQS